MVGRADRLIPMRQGRFVIATAVGILVVIYTLFAVDDLAGIAQLVEQLICQKATSGGNVGRKSGELRGTSADKAGGNPEPSQAKGIQ